MVLLGVVTLAWSCSASLPTLPATQSSARRALAAELADARGRWASARPAAYRYKFKRACNCTSEYTAAVWLHVMGSRVTDAVRIDSGKAVDLAGYPSVEGLFDAVQTALDQDAYFIRVTYDSRLGYPVSLFVDQNPRIADEELLMEASDLEATNPSA